MDCKHLSVEGNTTKYYFCKVKNKAIDTIHCRDCMLRISALPKEFEEVFGKGFR